MRNRSRDFDMTHGSILYALVSFAIPMAIGLLLQQFYNTVDTIVVGRFVGESALAAVGSTSDIINMVIGASAGLSVGTSVIISQRYGAHDEDGLSQAIHTAITLSLIFSVVAACIGVLVVKPMLRMMDTPGNVFKDASAYLTVYFIGVCGPLMYNMGAGILRAVGDSRRPLYILCFSAIINMLGDLLFVIVFDLGVIGVALATVLAQSLSAILVLIMLTRTDSIYKIRWRKLGISSNMLRQILSLGLPSSIQQGITSFSNTFVLSYINYYGSACMAGWTACNKVDAFVLIPIQSIALASTTFVGQNYGAREYKRARAGVRSALILSIMITLGLSLLVILFRSPLVTLFTEVEEVHRYGTLFVLICSPFYIARCFNQVYSGALRGIGSAKLTMFIQLFSFTAVRQIYLLINRLLGGTVITMALSYPVGWCVCSLLVSIFYHRSKLFREQPEQKVQ